MRHWDASALLPLLIDAERTAGSSPATGSDAAQLGAALLVSDELGAPLPFVCLDQRLAEAADREGLPTLPAA